MINQLVKGIKEKDAPIVVGLDRCFLMYQNIL